MASVAIKIVSDFNLFRRMVYLRKLFKAIKDKFGNQVKQPKQNVPAEKGSAFSKHNAY